MLEKINDLYNESIQNQIAASKMLPDLLMLGAKKMTETLLSGNKIIVSGQGRAYTNAQSLVANLLHRYELSRPSFPAVLISLDGTVASAFVTEDCLPQLFLRQFEAQAQKGDLLITFAPCGNEDNILQLIQNAISKGLQIIVLTGSNNDHVKGFLSENDLEIPVPSRKESRILEQHLFITNSLCELVDYSLFAHS